MLRRLAWNRPAPTLLTSPTMRTTMLIHPEELRPLSVNEYKRLQTFPDDWQIHGTLTQQYRQLGNAVPVRFAQALGDTIIKHKQGVQENNRSPDKYSRYRNVSSEFPPPRYR